MDLEPVGFEPGLPRLVALGSEAGQLRRARGRVVGHLHGGRAPGRKQAWRPQIGNPKIVVGI